MSGIMSMLLGAKSAIAVAVDEFFNRVTLLLPGNGTNGAQNNTFLDSSTNNFTITRNGNTTQGTFSPFSQTGWSNFFGGSGNYAVSNAAVFTSSTSTFTIEGWIFPTAAAVSNSNIPGIIGDMQPASTAAYWSFGTLASGAVTFYWYDGASKNATTSGTVSLNTWTHIAVSVNSNAITIYINGVQQTLTGTTTLTNRTGSNSSVAFAQFSNAGSLYTGYLSNFSVLSGTAKYSGSFTPSTTPLAVDTTNQVLLFAAVNRFADSNTATTAKTFTLTGTPSVQAFSPFLPTAAYSAATVGGSGYFDGTGDNLSSASGSSTALGSGDFTVECWYYQTAAGVYGIFGNLETNSDLQWAFVTANTSGTVRFQGWNTLFLTATEPPRNQWNHIAVSRSSTTMSMFLNGTRVATATNSTNFSATTNITVGGTNGTNNFLGYISNARVVKGTAVYDPTQTSITVPTAPLTAITNTQFLTNFTNAGITDATAKNVLETVGNAQISTTQSKFGGSSMYFDGNGDYLILPDSTKENLRFGTGNFTIEFWAWKSADGASSYDTPISVGSNGNFNGGFAVELSATRGFCFIYDAAVRISSSLNPNDSTWHHYAVVRNGSTFALYRDGVQLTTSTLTPTLGITGTANIANGANGTTFFNGYIDDLRVTKGLARYTAAFTPPTAAFALQ